MKPLGTVAYSVGACPHSLDRNNLTNDGDDMSGIVAVAKALKSNSSLTSIRRVEAATKPLSTVAYSVSAPWHFAHPKPLLISHIHSVSGNSMFAEGAKPFTKMLERNTTIQSIQCAAR